MTDVARFIGPLAQDAHELANALEDGRGTDGLEVIYGGAYTDPAAKAALLTATAEVLHEIGRSAVWGGSR
jgi:hypothetical protein